ncbi:uncharacterized protein BO72DRAFT_154930 [Aspergillus fijiensis CBS 313.89]|uniref:Uncharacterized protein n=1 Tax=Aspergillus fijiensis CBS 313.89 TaxID=1448319 RepID=A0A8G1RQ26_9EURO|nr:uncharacterized protein BO72DRAFT_154930 [Aspergillus fijiensis CBS 313.89]RAK75850.1 hypothetical protein BO72DRAFT_154930 [Aspergillus fijiensis CBS 313.89]
MAPRGSWFDGMLTSPRIMPGRLPPHVLRKPFRCAAHCTSAYPTSETAVVFPLLGMSVDGSKKHIAWDFLASFAFSKGGCGDSYHSRLRFVIILQIVASSLLFLAPGIHQGVFGKAEDLRAWLNVVPSLLQTESLPLTQDPRTRGAGDGGRVRVIGR